MRADVWLDDEGVVGADGCPGGRGEWLLGVGEEDIPGGLFE